MTEVFAAKENKSDFLKQWIRKIWEHVHVDSNRGCVLGESGNKVKGK